MKKFSDKTIERFKRKILPIPNGCHIWIGAKYNGYGSLKVKYKRYSAHRIAFDLWNGDSTGFLVCHSCDIPACVNPAHLFLGTQQDNMDDMMRKNRRNPPKGERQWLSKLTKEDIISIRELYNSGNYTQEKIGSLYNVGQSNISYIINKTWSHVNP